MRGLDPVVVCVVSCLQSIADAGIWHVVDQSSVLNCSIMSVVDALTNFPFYIYIIDIYIYIYTGSCVVFITMQQ